MFCILVVGMTGQGKTRFIKQYIENKNCFVFDVQNEYSLSLNPNDKRSKVTDLDEKKFIETVFLKRNTICVFEEATGFFEGRLDRLLRRIVLSKRHTGNIFLFCFHSISAIPPRLMQLTNYVVLFKTGDEIYQVENKFPSLAPYFNKLKKMPNRSLLTIKTIPQ